MKMNDPYSVPKVQVKKKTDQLNLSFSGIARQMAASNEKRLLIRNQRN